MGFRDDVVVRVSPLDDGSRIDVRSASRYGVGDFGTNAGACARAASDIDDAASEPVPEPRPEPKKPPPKKPAPKKSQKR